MGEATIGPERQRGKSKKVVPVRDVGDSGSEKAIRTLKKINVEFVGIRAKKKKKKKRKFLSREAQ